MAKEDNEKKDIIEKLESISVGVVGHIDHGKTTLLQRVSGKWTDTHSEELKRGITIKLGYADTIIKKEGNEYNIEKGKDMRYVSFIDAPGHEMLMATMLSGAAIIDAAILVIAANEGIKPQTREHLMALQARGIKQILIVQNKIDLVSKEEAVKNYNDIKKFIKGTIAETAEIIPCSAQQNVNIDKILEAVCNFKILERDEKSNAVFVVARSFDINRPGSEIEGLRGGILGGALKKGILKVGDEIEIKPGINLKRENKIVYETIKTKILGLYKGKYKVDMVIPGSSIGIETSLDTVLTKSDNLSGCIVGRVGEVPEITDRIKIKFTLFPEVFGISGHVKAQELKTAELLLLSVNTSITIGQAVRISGNEAEMNLRIPIVPFQHDKVGIARNIDGHWRLIGFGEII